MTLTGVRLALDWGKQRIGVAACGRSAILAHPVATIGNDDATMRRLQELLEEYQPTIVYLGLPIALDGSEAQAAAEMLRHKRTGSSRMPVFLRGIGEALSIRPQQWLFCQQYLPRRRRPSA